MLQDDFFFEICKIVLFADPLTFLMMYIEISLLEHLEYESGILMIWLNMSYMCFSRGTRPFFFLLSSFPFFLLHCVPLYVCRLCINYQDLSTKLLGVGALRMRLLTFTSCFVIDFLSIRKVIIFSAIATDDRHPLRSRSLHQNAANCMTIRFHYIAQPRGVRKTYCARSRNDVRPLTSRSNAMPSKKTMELLEDVCRCRRPHVSR